MTETETHVAETVAEEFLQGSVEMKCKLCGQTFPFTLNVADPMFDHMMEAHQEHTFDAVLKLMKAKLQTQPQ